MKKVLYYLIVFNSKNHGFFLESILKRLGYRVELLQAPKYLSKDCNLAIKAYEEALDIIVEKITSKKLDVYRIYKHYIKDDKQIYEIIKY